ncbi:unnamed protein product [Prunus armeniaca]
MASFLIDNSFVKRKLASNALYSASLFEARKPSVIACSSRVPSGVMDDACSSSFLVRLSVYVQLPHVSGLVSFSSSTDGVNSATKSAKA